MISELLRHDVEQYVDNLRERSPLLALARSGKLGPEAVAVYLSGLRMMTWETVRLCERAAEVAARQQNEKLEAHYRAKVAEEAGHHRWAEDDLAGLSSRFGIAGEPTPSAALRQLTEYLERGIEEAPVHLLAYILLTEYVTVLIGPEWSMALEKACGISRSHLTVVDNHVALDQDHVDEGLEQIDALAGPSALSGLRRTMQAASRYIEEFFDEVTCVARATWDEEAGHRPEENGGQPARSVA